MSSTKRVHSADQKKVIHYNIYIGQGCDKEPSLDKLQDLGKWLRRHDADVVGLAECNGWHTFKILDICAALGYPYAAFKQAPGADGTKGRGTGNLMVLSKTPVEVVAHEDAPDVFHHAMLHVKTAGMHVIETHMSPRNSAQRREEICVILSAIDAVGEEPLLLMADCNNMLPSSAAGVDEAALVQKMRVVREGKLIKRYCQGGELLGEGLRPVEWAHWAIDYCPIQMLCTRVQELLPEDPVFTYPSSKREDQHEDPEMRIDAMFANPSFCTQYESSIRALKEPENETLSDHYPLEACLQLNEKRIKDVP
eukprot:TRINITY_DN21734_c0_g1_i1.p1 TRINITY_DN21734_c0_g1~~TRINITY_DN21734_c0_g1_i1.p1  ORF type:complete len:309 (-),score=77.08 TRINITY_DN21734_c0_g1_i1:369-1295(-)